MVKQLPADHWITASFLQYLWGIIARDVFTLGNGTFKEMVDWIDVNMVFSRQHWNFLTWPYRVSHLTKLLKFNVCKAFMLPGALQDPSLLLFEKWFLYLPSSKFPYFEFLALLSCQMEEMNLFFGFHWILPVWQQLLMLAIQSPVISNGCLLEHDSSGAGMPDKR